MSQMCDQRTGLLDHLARADERRPQLGRAPRAFRLTTRSDLVGCSTGMSPVSRRTQLVDTGGARRNMSVDGRRREVLQLRLSSAVVKVPGLDFVPMR